MTPYSEMIDMPRMVRAAVRRLLEPSLGEVLNHPERWHIVRIVNGTLEVVDLEARARLHAD